MCARFRTHTSRTRRIRRHQPMRASNWTSLKRAEPDRQPVAKQSLKANGSHSSALVTRERASTAIDVRAGTTNYRTAGKRRVLLVSISAGRRALQASTTAVVRRGRRLPARARRSLRRVQHGRLGGRELRVDPRAGPRPKPHDQAVIHHALDTMVALATGDRRLTGRASHARRRCF